MMHHKRWHGARGHGKAGKVIEYQLPGKSWNINYLESHGICPTQHITSIKSSEECRINATVLCHGRELQV